MASLLQAQLDIALKASQPMKSSLHCNDLLTMHSSSCLRNSLETEVVHFDNFHVWLGRHDKLLRFIVVAPEVAKRSCHCQERHLLDSCVPSDRALVGVLGAVPDDSVNSLLLLNFAAVRFDSAELFWGFRFVFGCQRLRYPLSTARIGSTQHDPRVATMAQVQFAFAQERD